MMHSIALENIDNDESRILSDEELQAVSGGKGKSGPICVPLPAPTTGSTAGLVLFPLIRCTN